MEFFVLHILKLNIIAASVILLVRLLAVLFKRASVSKVEVFHLAVDYGKSLYSCAPSGKFYPGGF